MATDDFRECDDIFVIANLWRGKWAVIKGFDGAPHHLGRKLDDLHDIAHHLARLARTQPMSLAEIAAVTDIELAILRDEMRSAVLKRAL